MFGVEDSILLFQRVSDSIQRKNKLGVTTPYCRLQKHLMFMMATVAKTVVLSLEKKAGIEAPACSYKLLSLIHI